jgi:hypothetical protein
MLIPFTVTRRQHHGSFGREEQCDYTSYCSGARCFSGKSARTRFVQLGSVAGSLGSILTISHDLCRTLWNGACIFRSGKCQSIWIDSPGPFLFRHVITLFIAEFFS